jgi:hypothetical protein
MNQTKKIFQIFGGYENILTFAIPTTGMAS